MIPMRSSNQTCMGEFLNKMNTNKKLLTLDESLNLDQTRAIALYKTHVNAGLMSIYEMLGFDDIDVTSAEGVYINLRDGRKLLDFTSALGILALGHNHPQIIAAEKKCLDAKMLNAIKLAPHKLQSALAYNLSVLLPSPLSVSFFSTSGAEAVEAAMKLCEKAQGKNKKKFVTTGNSYHGKTHTSLSMTRSGHYRDSFIQGIPEENVIEVPFGNSKALEQALKENDGQVIAAIIEPIQGQGLDTPPKGYLSEAVKLCHEHGALVIFDEVKTGASRCGTFCAFQAEEVVPDVVTISKALSGGLRAIGAMTTSEALFKKAYGKKMHSSLHTTTFGGLGLTCAVAIEATNILGDPGFQESIKEKGAYLRKRLEELKHKYPNKIKSIKGKGLLQGIEFNFKNIGGSFNLPNNPLIDTYNKGVMAGLIRTLYKKHDILAHFSDSDTEILHIMPPLIVEKEHLDKFVAAIENILENGFINLALDLAKDIVVDKIISA